MKIINQVELPSTPYTSTIIGCPAPAGATCIVIGDTWKSVPFKAGTDGDITTIQCYYENEPDNISLSFAENNLTFYQGHFQSKYATVLMLNAAPDEQVNTCYLHLDEVTALSITIYYKNSDGALRAEIQTVTKPSFAVMRSPNGLQFTIFGRYQTQPATLYSVFINDIEYSVVHPLTATTDSTGRWTYPLDSRLIEVIIPNN